MKNALNVLLPDGRPFAFWEKETVYTRTLYVDGQNPAASDMNDGSESHPFRTIQRAADLAEPATRIRIHAGIYRECVRPRKGGTDPEHMISYEAFGDGPVVLRASEEVTDFAPSTGWSLRGFGMNPDVSSARVFAYKLDPDLFRGYNPFCAVNIIHDRLFIEYDKTDMTPYLNRRGVVYCDGKPLKQVALCNNLGESDGTYWVEHNGQTVHFRLPGDEDPADHRIEVSVREQCFAPEEPFLSYIRVKGLVCEHAANGAPVPQRGAISAFRGHHWVIEDCEVNWANTVAVDVGNECWHHEHFADQIVGHSVIRGCTIRNAGVCGIAGLFAEEMLIENNVISGTGWQKMELSWEAGAIKLHNSVNGLIIGNVFRETLRADHLWLDCGNVNNRITCNLFLNGIEQREAIFIECTREGINLIDNNIIWNVEGRFDPAKIPVEPGSSGWYKLREHDVVNGYAVYGEGTDRLHIAHNLIGRCRYGGYYAKPVSFRMGMDRGGTSRKAKIFNNIFYECGESAITFPTADNEAEGNLYVNLRGGYLRVMYPEPENCLNLSAWQEFYGFDKTGQDACLGVSFADETGEVTVSEREDDPFFAAAARFGRTNLLRAVADIRPVAPDPLVAADCTGEKHPEGAVLPGPFNTLGKAVFPLPQK